EIVPVPAHLALVAAVNAVVFQKICHVIRGLAVAVDAHKLDVRALHAQSEDQAADSPKAVAAYFHTRVTNILSASVSFPVEDSVQVPPLYPRFPPEGRAVFSKFPICRPAATFFDKILAFVSSFCYT